MHCLLVNLFASLLAVCVVSTTVTRTIDVRSETQPRQFCIDAAKELESLSPHSFTQYQRTPAHFANGKLHLAHSDPRLLEILARRF